MKVSIIIPYKTDRGYLSEAIKSAEFQTYDGEIEIIESKSDHQVGYNINRGFEISTGDIIRFLCDDDKLNPTSIADSVKFFEQNPEIDFFHANAFNMNLKGVIISTHKARHTPKTADELARKNWIHGGTVVYRRKCFEEQTWDESLWTGEEYEYNMRLLANGFKLGYLDAVNYCYRSHPTQKSGRQNRNRARRIEAIKQIKNKYRNE